MSTPQNVLEALYTKLTAVQTAGTVHALTGGRIHHAQAPHNSDLPHLVYLVVANPVERYFGG